MTKDNTKFNRFSCCKYLLCAFLCALFVILILYFAINPKKEEITKPPFPPIPNSEFQTQSPMASIKSTKSPTSFPTTLENFIEESSYEQIGRILQNTSSLFVDPNIYDSVIAESFEDCKNLCNNNCFACQFREDTLVCNLFNQIPSTTTKELTNSNTFDFMKSYFKITTDTNNVDLIDQSPYSCNLEYYSYEFNAFDSRICQLRCQNRNKLCFGFIALKNKCFIFENSYPVVSRNNNNGRCSILK